MRTADPERDFQMLTLWHIVLANLHRGVCAILHLACTSLFPLPLLRPSPMSVSSSEPPALADVLTEDDDANMSSDMPQSRKRAAKAKEAKGEESPSKGKGKKKKEEEEEEVFRWWEQDPNGDDSIKWQTLVHNGVLFPPPYEPLPSHVKMKYKGIVISIVCASG